MLTSTLIALTSRITGSWKCSIEVEAMLHELWSKTVSLDLWTELKHLFLPYIVACKWVRSAMIERSGLSCSLSCWLDNCTVGLQYFRLPVVCIDPGTKPTSLRIGTMGVNLSTPRKHCMAVDYFVFPIPAAEFNIGEAHALWSWVSRI